MALLQSRLCSCFWVQGAQRGIAAEGLKIQHRRKPNHLIFRVLYRRVV